jgi:ubiquinone/menaquinone biosynthesis C-methylase UbiE
MKPKTRSLNQTVYKLMSFSPKRIFVMFVFGYGGTSLFMYRYSKLAKANEEVQSIVNKRQFLLDKHSSLAENFDKVQEKQEVVRKYKGARKTLLSYAKGSVLEMGVGTGANLHFYPKKTSLTGVDWSIKMLEEALAKDDENRMTFKLADCEKLPFADESFDTVVDTFSVQSYYDRN